MNLSFRRGLLLLLGVASLLSGGCRTLPRQRTAGARDEKRLSEALAYYGSGVLKESASDPGAGADYARAAELAPDAAAPQTRLAAWLVKNGRGPEAAEVMASAVRRNPGSYELRIRAGQIQTVLRNFSDAERLFREALRLDASRAEAHLQLAGLLVAQGRDEEALDVLREASGVMSEPLQAFRSLGEMHTRRIDFSKPPAGSEDLLEAIEYYERAALEPGDAFSLADMERLGDLYSLNMQFDEAQACYSRLISSQPDNIELRKKKARCFLAAGDRDGAVAELESLARRHPMRADTQYSLGELYESMGDIQSAAECYHLVMEIDPLNPAAYLRLALLETEFEIDNAIATIEYGLGHMPENLKLLDFLAYLQVRKGDYEAAMAVYERMRAAFPEAGAPDGELTQAFYINYGNAAEKAGMPEKAIALFQQAIDSDPSALEPYARLAFSLFNSQKKEKALEIMHQAAAELDGKPEAFLAKIYLGTLYNHAGRYAEAVETFREAESSAVTTGPDETRIFNAAFYFSFGAACERMGLYDEASEHLLMAIELDESHAEAYNYLAYMWAERDINLDKALEFVKKALTIEPDNGAFIDTLGWILYRKGDYRAALEQIKRANELMPDDPTVLDHLGDIHFALGEKAEAADQWRRSLEIEANDAIREKLSGLEQ